MKREYGNDFVLEAEEAARPLGPAEKPAKLRNGLQSNKVLPEDRAAHDWYRFVLSFPPHLIREYVSRLGIRPDQTVLDPFCGTGTTLVECQKLGIRAVGVEAHPMAHFASLVKTDWTPDPGQLLAQSSEAAVAVREQLRADGIEDDVLFRFRHGTKKCVTLRDLPPECSKLLLTGSISPLPLHKTLVLLEMLHARGNARFVRHQRLALAKALVNSISNLRFGPEVGIGSPKPDAPVVSAWLAEVAQMSEDLRKLRGKIGSQCTVHLGDSRQLQCFVPASSIDAVITSPPYPNEKDYTRTTRLESVLLGFIHNKADLRSLKQGLVRSNTRGVYKDDADDRWVAQNAAIQRIARDIEERRIKLGKTSGFERMYARVTKLYFGGMARHLAELRGVLKPGARLAYIVGDQASYLRVKIHTGQLLAELAQNLGYELSGIDLFRTRLATATREQLREEVVLLGWPGQIPAERELRKARRRVQ